MQVDFTDPYNLAYGYVLMMFQVNGFEVKLPYLRESVLMIEKNGHVVHVNTNLGVKVSLGRTQEHQVRFDKL